jgi:SAM-dependent methyltransferase
MRVTDSDRAHAFRLYKQNYSRYLPISKNSRVVELGCSEGGFLMWLKSQGYMNFFGMDSDPVAIDTAVRRLGETAAEIKCKVSDILDYVKSCESESIDVIFMNNVIEHLDKAYLLELIPEIRRVLMKDGKFIAQTGNIENPFNFGLYARDFTHQIAFTSNSLCQLMMMCGFERENVEAKPIKYPTTVRNLPLQLVYPAMGWMLKKMALLMRIYIHEVAPMIYVVAVKRQL